MRTLKLGRQGIADDYEVLPDYFPHLERVPLLWEILLDTAVLRACQKLHRPDAIRIATALGADATLAVTSDKV